MGTDAMTPVDAKLSIARFQYRENDPPVKVNQRWIALSEDGEILRRVRIVALHPDVDSHGERQWIYQEEPAKMRFTNYGELKICPEFNLRYVFRLETE